MKILLVEDHPALAQISCDLLREVHGHDVAYAATATEALALFDSFRPDTVLIDLNLPDLSGYELASRLRARPTCQDTVLVALTGFGGLINAEKASAAGFDARFRKPMNFDELPSIKRRARG